MYCFKSPKMHALSNFEERKWLKFYLAGRKRWKGENFNPEDMHIFHFHFSQFFPAPKKHYVNSQIKKKFWKWKSGNHVYTGVTQLRVIISHWIGKQGDQLSYCRVLYITMIRTFLVYFNFKGRWMHMVPRKSVSVSHSTQRYQSRQWATYGI